MTISEIFKTSFKGYNKEEVVAYIENLNHQYEQLQSELDSAQSRLAQLEEEQQEAAVSPEQQEAQRAALIEELTPALKEQLRGEVEQEVRARIESEIRIACEERARAEAADQISVHADEIQELRRRAQLYDDNREVLAELMIRAKNDATGIIHDAEEQARRLREESEQRFKLLTSDYEMLKNNLIASKNEAAVKLNGALKQLDEFERRFTCTDQDVERSAEHLEKD